jgi:hypothetical protein
VFSLSARLLRRLSSAALSLEIGDVLKVMHPTTMAGAAAKGA